MRHRLRGCKNLHLEKVLQPVSLGHASTAKLQYGDSEMGQTIRV